MRQKFLILILLTMWTLPIPANADSGLDLYHQAIAAKTIGERRQGFEKALAWYMKRFNEMKAQGKINGYLCYNIGNCYFNLGQLGEAILYYKMGLKRLPGNEMILANLQTALARRIDPVDMESGGIKETLLFFHYNINTAKRIHILIITAVIAAILLAGLIIKPATGLKYAAGVCLAVWLILLVSIGVEYYMPRHEGVIVHTTDIRRGPGTGFAPVLSSPLQVGSTIEVLTVNDGWYIAKLNDGRKGYILKKHLKLVL